jgi:hypothetical protein
MSTTKFPDPHFFGSWIGIRIVKIQKLERLKIEPWRAVDTHNGADFHLFDEEQHPNPH